MASSYAVEVATNAELVEEITPWLPPKSVIRFKAVCRKWRDITSAPYFISAHTRRNPHKASGILFHVPSIRLPHSNAVPIVSCPLDGGDSRVFREDCALDGYVHYRVLQCCYGLLLAAGLFESPDIDGEQYCATDLWVCNPTTGHRRILPEIEFDMIFDIAVLAFDPSLSTSYHVFVACSHHPTEIKVFHSETAGSSSWKTFGTTGSSLSKHSCFLGGVVYWLGHHDESLVTIDIEQGSINETVIPLPDRDQYWRVAQLYESRGRPNLLRSKFVQFLETGILQILELASDHSRWLLRHRVYMDDVFNHGPNLRRSALSYQFAWKEYLNLTERSLIVEHDQGDKFVVCMGKMLVAYDLGSKTHVVLCSSGWEMGLTLFCACANTLAAP